MGVGGDIMNLPSNSVPPSAGWIKATVEAMKEDIIENRSIGVEARRLASKPHECFQKEEIKELRVQQMSIVEELGNWKFFKRLFFVLIGLVISAIGGSMYFFVGTSSAVESNTYKVQRSVDELNHKHEKLVQKVDTMVEIKSIQEKAQLEEIKKVLKDEIQALDLPEITNSIRRERRARASSRSQ